MAAGRIRDEPRVLLGDALGDDCLITSDALSSSTIHDVALDRSGRAWVATDHALTVLDREGHILATWPQGTLAGVTGEIDRVLVAAAGPATLPAPGAPRIWAITGRVEIYRSSGPLADVEITLCSGVLREAGCKGAPLVRSARTAADGTFRLTDVPEGDYYVHVTVPPGNPDCGGIFRESPAHRVALARECGAQSGATGMPAAGDPGVSALRDAAPALKALAIPRIGRGVTTPAEAPKICEYQRDGSGGAGDYRVRPTRAAGNGPEAEALEASPCQHPRILRACAVPSYSSRHCSAALHSRQKERRRSTWTPRPEPRPAASPTARRSRWR